MGEDKYLCSSTLGNLPFHLPNLDGRVEGCLENINAEVGVNAKEAISSTVPDGPIPDLLLEIQEPLVF